MRAVKLLVPGQWPHMSTAPRVGTAAWKVARLAWRDAATTSARAVISSRMSALPHDDEVTQLEAGAHDVPTSRDLRFHQPWPPRETVSPLYTSTKRHIIDDAWPAEQCVVLASTAASALAPLRDATGEASVSALGDAARDVLGDVAHVAMRRALREMRRAAEREFFRTAKQHTKEGCAPRLYPVGGLLTHIVPETNRSRAFPFGFGVKRETKAHHGYWSAHVDKANVPEYDVSAVLYLSNGTGRNENQDTTDFTGGELTFLDPPDPRRNVKKARTRVSAVVPKPGRLLLFASGEENVHAVRAVRSGKRATLNLWLTADPNVGKDPALYDSELE